MPSRAPGVALVGAEEETMNPLGPGVASPRAFDVESARASRPPMNTEAPTSATPSPRASRLPRRGCVLLFLCARLAATLRRVAIM